MDDESKRNGVAESEKVTKKVAEGETDVPIKDAHKPKMKRSRSRTPQSKSDDAKNVQLQIKKKVHEKNDNVTEEKEETGKEGDSNRSTRSKTQKEKEEPSKTEGDGKLENSEDCPKKDDTVKKDTTAKKEKTPQKESTPKKNSPSDSKKELFLSKKEQKQDSPSTLKKDGTSKKDSVLKKEEKKSESPLRKKDASSKKDATPSPKETVTKKETPKKEANGVDSDSVEMDPLLVMPDEAELELLFDENSDMDSGKGSPIASRCTTRRSLTRNIPTPKTPRSLDTDMECDIASTITEPEINIDLDDNNELMDTTNLSMKAEVGSDITRLDYVEGDIISGHDDSYFNSSRERSLPETLKSLSGRRSIRDHIHTRVLLDAQERANLSLYENQSRSSVKRKNRSSTSPDGVKRFKPASDSTGHSLFSSPIATLRSRFSRPEINSSTPKLLVYKDRANDLHCEADYENVHGDDEKKSWCSVM